MTELLSVKGRKSPKNKDSKAELTKIVPPMREALPNLRKCSVHHTRILPSSRASTLPYLPMVVDKATVDKTTMDKSQKVSLILLFLMWLFSYMLAFLLRTPFRASCIEASNKALSLVIFKYGRRGDISLQFCAHLLLYVLSEDCGWIHITTPILRALCQAAAPGCSSWRLLSTHLVRLRGYY